MYEKLVILRDIKIGFNMAIFFFEEFQAKSFVMGYLVQEWFFDCLSFLRENFRFFVRGDENVFLLVFFIEFLSLFILLVKINLYLLRVSGVVELEEFENLV